MSDASRLIVVASPMKSSGKKNEVHVVRVSDTLSSLRGAGNVKHAYDAPKQTVSANSWIYYYYQHIEC